MSNKHLVTRSSSILRVQRCLVAWSLKNVRSPDNTITITKDGTTSTITLSQGYYTFTDLEETLKSHDITIKKLFDNRITLQSVYPINLQHFGPLLGFNPDQSILANTLTTSSVSASLTNKLKNISVSSQSLVDSTKVFSHRENNNYECSTRLFDLSIDTTQSLNGNFTEYNLNAIEIPCRNFYGQEFYIFVESAGHANDYVIYLTLSID